MSYLSKLTSKSQITVPKDVRVALGVGPGERVQFDIGPDGKVSLAAAGNSADLDQRKAEFLNRFREAQAAFKGLDTMPGSGMDGLAYQRMLRGNEFAE